MSEKSMIVKPVATAVGVAFVTSLAVSTSASATDNPFAAADLDSGYLLAGNDAKEEGKCGEGKCGSEGKTEGKCGASKGEEGKCGEGKCGENKAAEGSCGEHKAEAGGSDMKGEEGSCGEKKAEEGNGGGDKG